MNFIKGICYTLLLVSAIFFSNGRIYAKTLNFAVASDVHYSPAVNAENAKSDISAKALRGFVDRVNENDYDFVIFLGDNIDKSKPQNLKRFFNVIKNMKTPYYLVLGNSDAHKISGMSKPDYLKIVSQNNKSQKKAQSSYYFCPTSDVIVIVIDNVSSGMPSSHGMFTEKTLKWLDEVLTKNKNKKAVIFQHVPYIEPYEKDSYNILERHEYGAVIRRHKNIVMICSGHYHKYALTPDDRGIYHLSAPALYEHPYKYLDIKLDYNKKPLTKAKNFKLDVIQKPAI